MAEQALDIAPLRVYLPFTGVDIAPVVIDPRTSEPILGLTRLPRAFRDCMMMIYRCMMNRTRMELPALPVEVVSIIVGYIELGRFSRP
jgi:hypothetical protein